jgi:hypothetical protein
MRYIGDLITEVRRDTENDSYSSNSPDEYGIKTEDFFRYANFAVQRLQAKLIASNATIFRRQTDIQLVANQAEYSIPDNVYLSESIVDMKYSPNGQETDLREIREIADSNRYYGDGSHINAYVRRQGKIYTSPKPNSSQGFLRTTYQRAIDQLDLRRGVITSSSVAGGGTLSADTLTISTTGDDPDRISNVSDKYLCVVDKDGNVKARNIPYTAYTSGTGAFTHPAHVLGDLESITTGDYITVGKYTSTHLTDIAYPEVEKYLQLYMAMKILGRDSNTDMVVIRSEFYDMENTLMESVKFLFEDEWEINIDRPDMLLLNRY